jgi:RND family efflux transporter MFP subunit
MSVHHPLLAFVFLAQAGLCMAAGPIILLPAQATALGIQTILVGASDPAHGGTLPARVLVPSAQMRIVAAPLGGTVETLAVATGSVVRRGQVLATLASPQALELQREALQSATQTTLLRQNLKRDEQLFAEGLIAESRLQASRSAAAEAIAKSNERRQGLALAGLAPGRLGGPLALTAPIDGVVLEQGVQLGQRVDTSALIYRVARLSPLWLEIQAPLELAELLSQGMPVKVRNSSISGRLIAVGRTVDPSSQTILLRAEVENDANLLAPGQVVEVELSSPGENRQRLPASALVRHDGKTLVFVRGQSDDKGSHFEARELQIVSQSGNSVTVDGVKAGEIIVVKGASGLKAILTGVGEE